MESVSNINERAARFIEIGHYDAASKTLDYALDVLRSLSSSSLPPGAVVSSNLVADHRCHHNQHHHHLGAALGPGRHPYYYDCDYSSSPLWSSNHTTRIATSDSTEYEDRRVQGQPPAKRCRFVIPPPQISTNGQEEGGGGVAVALFSSTFTPHSSPSSASSSSKRMNNQNHFFHSSPSAAHVAEVRRGGIGGGRSTMNNNGSSNNNNNNNDDGDFIYATPMRYNDNYCHEDNLILGSDSDDDDYVQMRLDYMRIILMYNMALCCHLQAIALAKYQHRWLKEDAVVVAVAAVVGTSMMNMMMNSSTTTTTTTYQDYITKLLNRALKLYQCTYRGLDFLEGMMTSTSENVVSSSSSSTSSSSAQAKFFIDIQRLILNNNCGQLCKHMKRKEQAGMYFAQVVSTLTTTFGMEEQDYEKEEEEVNEETSFMNSYNTHSRRRHHYHDSHHRHYDDLFELFMWNASRYAMLEYPEVAIAA